MLVKLVRYYEYPDLRRQTPKGSFKWGTYTFTEEAVEECDYLVILDHPKKDFSVKVKKSNIIHICQEPPNETSLYRQYGNKHNSLIINQINTKKNNILLHGALPWHLNKDYDFLSNLTLDSLKKENKISWVTSNKNTTKGHMQRMNFLNKIKDLDFVHLYGRGIKSIDDKWDALYDSKYSIAYENYSNDYYWTEKISDAFLAFSMPIYVGCNKVSDFFPKDSYIQIDPNDKHIQLFFKDLVKSKTFDKGKELILEARNLVLEKYQLFPYLVDLFENIESEKKVNNDSPKLYQFKGGNDYFDNYPMSIELKRSFFKLKRRINTLFTN
jgi:hypothetical protein